MITIAIICWLLSGFISALIIIKKKFDGDVEFDDILACMLAGTLGPIVPLAILIAWLINKL